MKKGISTGVQQRKTPLLAKIASLILALCIITESNSIYSQLFGYHHIIRLALIVFSIICLLLLISASNIEKVLKKKTILLSALIMISGLLMLIKTRNTTGTAIAILIVSIAYPLFISFSYLSKEIINEVLKRLLYIIIFLSIISVLFWLLVSISHVLSLNCSVRYVWGYPYSTAKGYSYLYFETQDVWWITGSRLVRNTGIFAEGPMYAYLLLVALIINNFYLDLHNRKIINVILLITVVSTMSTTGVVGSLLIIAFVNHHKIRKNLSTYKGVIRVIATIAIIIAFLPFGIRALNAKGETSSSRHRRKDIENGLVSYLENPLLGKGINHERDHEGKSETGYGYSNSIIPVLTDGGIVLMLIYIYPLVSLLLNSLKSKNLNGICISIIYIMILLTTLVPYRLSILLVLALMLRGAPPDLNENKTLNGEVSR